MGVLDVFFCWFHSVVGPSQTCTPRFPCPLQVRNNLPLKVFVYFKESRVHSRHCFLHSSVSKWDTHLAQISRNVKQCTFPYACRLIRIFTGRILNSQVCKISCVKRRFRSDYAVAQCDLSLRCARMSNGTFSHVAAQIFLKCCKCFLRIVFTLFSHMLVLLLLYLSTTSRKHTYIILTPLNPTFI